MILRATALAVMACLGLVGCGAPGANLSDSTPAEVAAAHYRHDGPPALTLFTMINNRSGAGAHSSIMVNAPSERVVFDPAGSVRAKNVPEMNDVLYGITPAVADFYARAHARNTYRVRIQRIEVSPAVAEQALRIVKGYGSVSQAQCTVATSAVLKQLPGFETIKSTWFPVNLADQMAKIPGVSERTLREEDSDDKELAIKQFEVSTTQ